MSCMNARSETAAIGDITISETDGRIRSLRLGGPL